MTAYVSILRDLEGSHRVDATVSRCQKSESFGATTILGSLVFLGFFGRPTVSNLQGV